MSNDNVLRPLGKILHEFDPRNLKITVFNNKDVLLYTVKADILQIGFWVNQNLVCDSCQKAFIYIYDDKDERVGLMEKVIFLSNFLKKKNSKNITFFIFSN